MVFYNKKIRALYWHDDEEGVEVGDVLGKAKKRCTRIDVVMIPGDGAMVPWFNVWSHDVLLSSHNALHISSVSYIP